MAAPRQTYSYLRDLFARHGVAPRRQFGQNFLIDLNLHDLILSSANVAPGDIVLEVGPGAGALTARLAATGATVVAVEIDPAMAKLTALAVDDNPAVRVLRQDALAGKNTLAPEVVDALRSALATGPDRKLKLVANLPYNVATPILSNLLVHPELGPALATIVITIQKELAERILAPAATEAYGALSVLIQALADSEIVRILPPSVFWPRPKVESAVLRIVPDPARRAALANVEWFHRTVRTIFLHRRKNLRRVLHGFFGETLSKERIDAMLEEIGLTGEIRAESMNVDEHRTLAEALHHVLGGVWSARGQG